MISTILLATLLQQAPAAAPSAPPTDEAISNVKAMVEAKLRDPYSAQWRNLRAFQHTDGSLIVCGEVNAKNAYGGYVGFDGFVYWNGKLTMPDESMPIVAPHQRNFVKLLCSGKP